MKMFKGDNECTVDRAQVAILEAAGWKRLETAALKHFEDASVMKEAAPPTLTEPEKPKQKAKAKKAKAEPKAEPSLEVGDGPSVGEGATIKRRSK